MLRSDYSSDYKGQKPVLRDSIATNVATTPFKNQFEWPKQREGIYKEKKIGKANRIVRAAKGRTVLLSPPAGGMLGSGFSLQAAFWYQKAMLALLPRGGESLMPRFSAGRERRELPIFFSL